MLGEPQTIHLTGNEMEVVKPLVDAQSLYHEWTHIKSIVRSDPRLNKCTTTAELIVCLHQHYSDELPNILSIADWGLAIPLATADSERDLSKLGIMKTAR